MLTAHGPRVWPRSPPFGLVFLVLVGVEATARAAPREHATVRLSYARGRGADQCPDEGALRDAVSARLGYDPFDDHAPRLLVAEVHRSGRSLAGHVELQDASGTVQGRRDLRAEGNDCAELATAMSIAVSLGIDPLSALEPSPPPSPAAAEPPPAPSVPAPAVVVPPAPPSPSLPVEAPSPSVPVHLRFGLGTMLSWGISPAIPSIGVAVDAGIRRGLWSLGLEGAGNWQTQTATDGASGVKSSLTLISLVPCVHVSIALGCALGGVGSLAASGVVSSPLSSSSLFADAGVRLGIEWPLTRWLLVAVHADGLATFTHVTYHLDNQIPWSTPPVSGALGLGVVVEL